MDIELLSPDVKPSDHSADSTTPNSRTWNFFAD
jgi:hypothetical protein